jgi:hypothetical protein
MKSISSGEKFRITLNLEAKMSTKNTKIVESLFRLIILKDANIIISDASLIKKPDLIFKSNRNNSLNLRY